jgi:hypothetical protein
MFIGSRCAAVAALTVVLCGVGTTERAWAQPAGLVRIAGFQDVAPGSIATYDEFFAAPSIANGVVAYHAGWSGAQGVHRWNAGLRSSIIDTFTFQPAQSTPFSAFSSVSAAGGAVAFLGQGAQFNGVYGLVNNTLRNFGDGQPLGENAPPIFDPFGAPSIDGDAAVFWAMTPNSTTTTQGIYRTSVKATENARLVGFNTVVPGSTQSFAWFGVTPVGRNINVLFNGGDGGAREGLYVAAGAGVSVFVDNTTTVTNSPATVSNIRDNFAFDGSRAAFIGEGIFNIPGVYLGTQGSATLVSSLFDAIPDGFGAFSDFQDVSLSGNNVVFTAIGPQSQQGIYGVLGGELTKIIDLKTVIEPDKSLALLTIGREALDGDLLAFRAEFTDGTSGLYMYDLARIPSPSTLALAAAGGVALMTRRRR